MDYTKIVEKAIKSEDYSADVKDFTPEQNTELNLAINKKAKEAADAELARVAALKKEGARVQDKNNEGKVEDAQLLNTFKTEQENAARNEFFSNPDYTLTDSEKAVFDNYVKKLSSGEISKEAHIAVFKAAYGATKPDELVKERKNRIAGEKNAVDFNSRSAGAGGSGPGVSELEKYSPNVQALYKSWQQSGFSGKNYTIERAKRIVEGGMSRNL